jgi:hypothetical protein
LQIRDWMPVPADSLNCAIDRVLERNSELICVTKLPFITDLQPNAHTTLWTNGGKNSEIYASTINKAQSYILKKIDDYNRLN